MENRQFNTKGLVEASLLSVITAIFMWLNINVPLFFIFAALIIPIPIAIVYVRYGYKMAILSIVISYILLALLGRPAEAVLEIISGFLPGITLGYCIRKEKPAITTIIYIAVATIAATIATTVVMAVLLTPEGLPGVMKSINQQIADMKNIFIETRKSYEGRMGDQELQLLNQMIDKIDIKFFFSTMPGMLSVLAFLSSLATYFFTEKLLSRLKIKVKKLRPFSTLYINNLVGAAAIILLCIGLLLDLKGITAGQYIYNFIFITGTFSLIITGSSLVTYFFRVKLKFPKLLVIGIIIFTCIQFAPFYIGLGLTDIIMDVRKLDPNRIFKR